MGGEDYNNAGAVSESGNWNVADKFSKVKIMLPLAKCEQYEDLAVFGYESIIDEFMQYNNVAIPIDVIRMKGLNRLVKELLKICSNTKFAMQKHGTKDELEGIEKKLKAINQILPALYTFKVNQVRKTKELVLDQDKFSKILDKVINLKSDLNNPLNKNDLIFIGSKEGFDPRKAKKELLKRMSGSPDDEEEQ